MDWLKARWAERSTKTAILGCLGFIGGIVSGTMDPTTALFGIAYTLAHMIVPDNQMVNIAGAFAPAAPVIDASKLKSIAVVGLLALGLSSCAQVTAFNAETPAQKFATACDGYVVGKDALGPLIQAIAAKNATSAAVYSDAVFVLNTACAKNPDGSYVEASGPNLAALLPKVLQATGYLTALFVPAS